MLRFTASDIKKKNYLACGKPVKYDPKWGEILIETDQEMTQMVLLVDKNIETIVVTIFRMFESERQMRYVK